MNPSIQNTLSNQIIDDFHLSPPPPIESEDVIASASSSRSNSSNFVVNDATGANDRQSLGSEDGDLYRAQLLLKIASSSTSSTASNLKQTHSS